MNDDTIWLGFIFILMSGMTVVFLAVGGGFASDRGAYVEQSSYKIEDTIMYDRWTVKVDRKLGDDRLVLTTKDFDYAKAVCDSIDSAIKNKD
jgi:hypothetical protein